MTCYRIVLAEKARIPVSVACGLLTDLDREDCATCTSVGVVGG